MGAQGALPYNESCPSSTMPPYENGLSSTGLLDFKKGAFSLPGDFEFFEKNKLPSLSHHFPPRNMNIISEGNWCLRCRIRQDSNLRGETPRDF